jgi:hypothetical protein
MIALGSNFSNSVLAVGVRMPALIAVMMFTISRSIRARRLACVPPVHPLAIHSVQVCASFFDKAFLNPLYFLKPILALPMLVSPDES